MKNEKEIFNKVFEMFCSYGIKSLTMSDIAYKLGISKKTLYKYVSDKEDLVKKVFSELEKPHKIKEMLSENLSAIEQFYLVYNYVIDKIKNYNTHLMFDLKKHYPQVYENLRERRKEGIIRNIKQNISKGKKEGIYREDINSDLIANFFYIKVEALIDYNFVNSNEYSIKEIFRELFKYHIYALVNDKGRTIIKTMKNNENNEI